MSDPNPTITATASILDPGQNPAPPTTVKGEAETIRRMILQKIPATSLVPANILEQLNAFERGWFTIAKLWDAVRTRNHVVANVAGKREKRLGRMRWDVLIDADASIGKEAEAEKHKKALQDFYRGVIATELLEADVRGGLGTLLRQMARAVGHRYAVHEITWKPAQGSRPFTAEFRFWPLWSFEARIGKLRWLPQPAMGIGYDMPENEWLVSVSDGIMRATVGIIAIQQMGLTRLGGLEGENHYFRRGDERKPLIFRRIARKKGL